MEKNIQELHIIGHFQIKGNIIRISFLKKPNVLRKKLYSSTLKRSFSIPIVMR